MGYRHTKEEILEGAVAVAFDEGLSRLTFGRVAKHLGINDRTVVYYFASIDDLATAVLLDLGVRLQATLAPAFGTPSFGHVELVRRAWPYLARPESDPTFSLFFEANGLAAAGREPYRSIVSGLVVAWIEWVEQFVDGPADQRRAEAETAIALIDGLLLLRLLGGPDAAERAARRLGVAG